MQTLHTYAGEALGDVRRAAVAALFALDVSMLSDEALRRLIDGRRDEVKYFIKFLRRVSSKLAEQMPLSETELELVKTAQRIIGQRGWGLKHLASFLNGLADALEAILAGKTYRSPGMISSYRAVLVEFINIITSREEKLLRIKP